MSSLPSLPPSAAPNVADHGAASGHRVVGTGHGGPGTSDAALMVSAATDAQQAVIPFEVILEAQLGAPALQTAAEPAGDDRPTAASAHTAESPAAPSQGAAQTVDALMLLSAGLPGPQAAAADPIAPEESADAAASVRYADSARIPRPLASAAHAAAVAATPAEPAAFSPSVAAAHDGASAAPAPASIAGPLQALPASGDATRPEPAPSAAGPNPAASVAPAPAERRGDAASGASQPSAPIPGTVGEPRWGDALSQRVVWMVGQQVQSAQFRVEPPQLGPIEVRLSIANDQASLTFAAPHAAARDAIQSALPRLQEMLMESGVSLSNVFVGSQAPQDQREYRSSGADGGTAPVSSEGQATSAAAPLRRVVGLVDLYA
jgi:flagellar hook-length control protein FliK